MEEHYTNSIIIPDRVKKIKSFAFASCAKLEKVIISQECILGKDTFEEVTNIIRR